MKIVFPLLMSVFLVLSGCATVKIDASMMNLCAENNTVKTNAVKTNAVKPTESLPGYDFGIFDKIGISGIPGAKSKLSGNPRFDDLMPINDEIREKGLKIIQGTTQKDPEKKDTDTSRASTIRSKIRSLVSWAPEYDGVSALSPNALRAAVDARGQIRKIWEGAPEKIASFDNIPSFDNTPLTKNQPIRLMEVSAASSDLWDDIYRTLSEGGYDALTIANAGYIEYLSEKQGDKNQLMQQAMEFNTAKFIAAYFRAYVRGGKFIQASVDTAALEKKLSDRVFEKLTDANLSENTKANISNAILDQLNKICLSSNSKDTANCLLTKSLGEESFVTRYGMAVQFSGITTTFGTNGEIKPSLTYPKSTEFGPQLVRVVTEAVFDSHAPFVPASPNSTACTTEGLYKDWPLLCLKEGQDDKVAEKVNKLDSYASQVEATVTALTSIFIRGVSVVSLNNEAIAKSLETFAGVSGRKLTEKVLWKHYGNSDCSERAFPMDFNVTK